MVLQVVVVAATPCTWYLHYYPKNKMVRALSLSPVRDAIVPAYLLRWHHQYYNYNISQRRRASCLPTYNDGRRRDAIVL
jgi:hypothetical protein